MSNRSPHHLHIDDDVWGDLEEIADREGRDEHELYRQALAQFIQNHNTTRKIHSEVPNESAILEGDKAQSLNFQVMWKDGGEDEPVSRGDVVHAIEPLPNYFDYSQFMYDGEFYVCQQYIRFSWERWRSISERVEAFDL